MPADRGRRRLLALAGILALAGPLASAAAVGCGGHEAPQRAGRPESSGSGEEADRERAARSVPTRDRIAYYQIATTSGFLRAEAATALAGSPRPPHNGTALKGGLARLAHVVPTDAGLRQLRDQLRAAALSWLGAPTRGPRAARAALRTTGRVGAGLGGYVRRHPALAGFIPG